MTGYLVRSTAGHDKGRIYVCTGTENGRLLLSDGRIKKVSRPKIKSEKHIEAIKCDISIKEKIENGDKAVNEAIKRAIKLYKREEENV